MIRLRWPRFLTSVRAKLVVLEVGPVGELVYFGATQGHHGAPYGSQFSFSPRNNQAQPWAAASAVAGFRWFATTLTLCITRASGTTMGRAEDLGVLLELSGGWVDRVGYW